MAQYGSVFWTTYSMHWHLKFSKWTSTWIPPTCPMIDDTAIGPESKHDCKDCKVLPNASFFLEETVDFNPFISTCFFLPSGCRQRAHAPGKFQWVGFLQIASLRFDSQWASDRPSKMWTWCQHDIVLLLLHTYDSHIIIYIYVNPDHDAATYTLSCFPQRQIGSVEVNAAKAAGTMQAAARTPQRWRERAAKAA